jgi:tetratricopeptide (TPR) repeat protein
MRLESIVMVAAAFVLVAEASHAQRDRAVLERAERDVRAARYADAESTLTLLTRMATGDELQRALFLLAGLQSSAEDAEGLYQRIVDNDPGSDWAKRAQLEVSKIQYALGNYGESYRILSDSKACDISDEACLFQGLSAIMLERYDQARRPLSSIRRGRLKTWAYLSLAEVESRLDRPAEACARYEALAKTMISPTALYRFGECLENRGDIGGATDEYREIIASFKDTPEAVLAAEKLSRIANPPPAASPAEATEADEEAEETEVLTSGFTIQFGSFRDRGNAIKLAAKIKRVYPGVRIDSELINYREYHRVRYGYFKTRAEAQAKGEEIGREMNEDFTIMTLP